MLLVFRFINMLNSGQAASGVHRSFCVALKNISKVIFRYFVPFGSKERVQTKAALLRDVQQQPAHLSFKPSRPLISPICIKNAVCQSLQNLTKYGEKNTLFKLDLALSNQANWAACTCLKKNQKMANF